MHVFKTLCLSVILVINEVNKVDSDCSLSLNQDFGKPQPVFIQNGKLLAPKDSSGAILVSASDTIIVGCVGNDRVLVLGKNTTDVSDAEATCIAGNIFRIGTWSGPFRDITCNAPPWFTAEFNGVPCYGGNEIVRVGYKVNGKFYTLYGACFDKNLLSTAYVRHAVSPASALKQTGRKRPQFIDGEIFGDVKMSELYKLKNQKLQLNTILGDDMETQYLTKKQGIRRRIDWLGKNVTVYTGTHAVSTLPDQQGLHMQLYLGTDQNNNGVVPVPMYFYKVIHDRKEKSAVAFVSINSSFYNKSMIDDLTFCDDICEGNPQFDWFKWRLKDGTHSFCCSFEQFNNVVPHLTHLKVDKLFF